MHETVKTAQEKMSKCLAALERELTTVRAGRANPVSYTHLTLPTTSRV